MVNFARTNVGTADSGSYLAPALEVRSPLTSQKQCRERNRAMNLAIAPSNGIGKLRDILRFNVRKFISVKQPAIFPAINFLIGQISFRKQPRRRNEGSKTATKNCGIYFASGGKSFAWR